MVKRGWISLGRHKAGEDSSDESDTQNATGYKDKKAGREKCVDNQREARRKDDNSKPY